jgi:hypothetical protein
MGKAKKLVKSDVLADMVATKPEPTPQERARNAIDKALYAAQKGWAYVSAGYKDGVINECARLGRLEKGDPNRAFYRWRKEDNGGLSVIHVSALVAPEAKRLADEILSRGGVELYPKTYPATDENGEPHPRAGEPLEKIDLRIWVETVRACLALVKAATGGEIRFRWNNWYMPEQPGLTVERVIKLDAAA